jgi:ectoine hydroxylase-related dioxygenase (phytanoyl-CoA dioxygenase family)
MVSTHLGAASSAIAISPSTSADSLDYGARVTTTLSLDEHIARVDEMGYTILENVIDLELIDELNEALLRLERDLGIVPATNLFEGLKTVRIYNLLAYGSPFEQVPTHPSVLPLAEAVLDNGLLVSSLSSIAIGPDEDAQPIHADDQVIPLAKPHAATVCNSMWALTDFTEENGATRLIPGTHKLDHNPEFTPDHDSIAAEMTKGSVLVWHGSLWHGGGANRTDRRRVGIAMNYCAGYIRQQENQQLGLPLSSIRGFSPRLRDLVGFGIYRGLIGHIDKQLPSKVLLDSDGGSMLWDLARPD